jgi:protein phosphatase
MRLSPEEIHWVGQRIPIPQFSVGQMTALVSTAQSILAQEACAVIDLPMPAWLIGDLHGNFHDLLRALSTIGHFSGEKLIFLGDYVDRGDYSLEVVLLLIALKCQFPRNIYLLRGNHEFAHINGTYGFKQELDQRFPESGLWEQFNALFAYLPIAAVLGFTYVCLHGGIGPTCTTLASIRQIVLPLENAEEGDVVSDVVWSDPDDQLVGFAVSPRGCGSLFGPVVLSAFLREAKAQRLIRAHQCVGAGLERFHRSRGMTIFTTSNYTGKGNSAGFVHIAAQGEVTSHQLRPIPDLVHRADAVFETTANPLEKAPRQVLASTSLSNIALLPHVWPRVPGHRLPKGKSVPEKRSAEVPDTRRASVRNIIKNSTSWCNLPWVKLAGLRLDADA